MKRNLAAALAALTLAACSQSDAVAPQNSATPTLESLSDAPNDWSGLSGAVRRSPGESGLFVSSPISTDLNAMLGTDVIAFRRAMVDAGPLRQGPDDTLVTRSESGAGWVVLQPGDHAMATGFRDGSGWRVHRTPGSHVPIAPDLREQ